MQRTQYSEKIIEKKLQLLLLMVGHIQHHCAVWVYEWYLLKQFFLIPRHNGTWHTEHTHDVRNSLFFVLQNAQRLLVARMGWCFELVLRILKETVGFDFFNCIGTDLGVVAHGGISSNKVSATDPSANFPGIFQFYIHMFVWNISINPFCRFFRKILLDIAAPFEFYHQFINCKTGTKINFFFN